MMSLAAIVGLLGALAASTDAADAATLDAMTLELKRSRSLALSPHPPPYHASYWVVDLWQHDARATLGTVVANDYSESRRVRAELRVGGPELDNSNFVGSGFDAFAGGSWAAPALAPRQRPSALRHVLWLETDAAYKAAIETLEQRRASREREIAVLDVPSFSEAPPTVLAEPRGPSVTDDPEHVTYAERVSAVFETHPRIQSSTVDVVLSTERRYFVATDGSRAVVQTPYSEVSIRCQTQADDGMPLEREVRLPVLSTDLPPVTEAIAAAGRIARELEELAEAPPMEDYSGPVLFVGHAAAQIAAELLVQSLSGTPAPQGAEGFESPLSRKLDKRILPRSVSVVDDPTLDRVGDIDLVGGYTLDDEGVPAQRVSLVEDGRLRSLLMSRAPSKEIQSTNGHGRSGLVGWARGRPGNLILTARGGLSPGALERRLLRAAREEGLGSGLVVTELESRSGATSGAAPPAPVRAYRLTPDGTRTLVRGGAFAEMSVRDLRDILAVGRTASAHHFAAPSAGGFALPMSVVSPALLFEDVEVRAPTGPHPRLPLVPSPPLGQGQRSAQQRKPVE